MSRLPLRPRPEVERIPPYVPGKPVQEVQRELGLRDVVKLASNENPLGPSPMAIAAARQLLPQVHQYPEAVSPVLREELARRWHLPAEWVFVGNGSDEIFRLLAEAYLRPGDRVVVPTPSFSVYTMVACLMGARVEPVPLTPDGAMDLRAMAAATQDAGDGPARMVFACRPNNPTGGVFDAESFRAFLERVPEGTLIVLDEAYKEFDPSDFEGRDWLGHHPHLVVTRTFSKIYGLAGLRLGYGLAAPEIWQPLYAVRDPFSVNVVAQAAGLAALSDHEHVARSVRLVEEGRHFFTRLAAELGLRTYPSAANFVLFDLGRDAKEVSDRLLRQGVIVRPATSFGLPTCIRVTCGLPEQNQRFAAALRAVLGVS